MGGAEEKEELNKGRKIPFFFSFSLNLLSGCIYCPGDNGSKNSPLLLRRATIRNTQLVEMLALRDDAVTLRDQTRSRFSFTESLRSLEFFSRLTKLCVCVCVWQTELFKGKAVKGKFRLSTHGPRN